MSDWMTDALVAECVEQLASAAPFGRKLAAEHFGLTEHKARALLEIARKQIGTDSENATVLKARISELEREVRRAYGKQRIVDQLAETMVAEIPKLPRLELKPLGRRADKDLDEEDIVIHISDAQVGQTVSAVGTGGLGHYNHEVFVERMARLRTAVRDCLEYHANPTPRCHLVFGGDIIEGATIFRGQQRQIDLGATKQVIYSYEHFARFIADQAELFDEVIVTGLIGNHGRLGLKGELDPTDNLDWLLYWFLRERFQLSGADNVRFNIPDTWWALLKIRDHLFHVSHGDDFRAWMGIPFYGALKYASRLREMLRGCFRKATDIDIDFDYCLVGHHHEYASFGPILMNGCWPGGSEFSTKTLQAGGPPFQRMFGVHEHYGVCWDRKLFLADPRELPRPTVYE